MKKTAFVISILASAMLAGACGGNKKAAQTTPPAGENAGSAAGSAEAPAAGSNAEAPAANAPAAPDAK